MPCGFWLLAQTDFPRTPGAAADVVWLSAVPVRHLVRRWNDYGLTAAAPTRIAGDRQTEGGIGTLRADKFGMVSTTMDGPARLASSVPSINRITTTHGLGPDG